MKINLCFLMALIFAVTTNVTQAMVLDLFELSNGLTSYTNILEHQSKSFLLSKFLKNKTFKNILTEDQIDKIHVNPSQTILLSFDEDKDIYQLKVLNQSGLSCGYHAIKNYLWMLKSLNSSLDQFGKCYFAMLSEDLYNKYQSETGCPSSESIAPYQDVVINKIKNNEITCAFDNQNPCIPKESSKYINDFLYIVFSVYGGSSFLQDIEKVAKEIIIDLESVNSDYNQFAYEVAVLSGNNTLLDTLYRRSNEFLTNSDFVLGINFNVWTSMDHAVCLIVNKVQNNEEYLFLDSLNKDFKTAYQGRYLQAIDTIKSFLSRKDYFEHALVRYTYVTIKYYIDKFFTTNKAGAIRIFNIHLPKINKFNLKNNNLYINVYKKHFIDLINNYKNQNIDQIEQYDRLLAEIV